MGAWGTGIFDAETTCDVREDFINYLEEGLSTEDATQNILEEYIDELNLEEDLEVISLVFIGLAAVQLEKNCLQEQVRINAIELIKLGADLELWEEAQQVDFEERITVLTEFKQKLLNYEVKLN
ncbi:DUF4259 domain-containing protein [Neobacillus ginsengisoli]|uniref:MarR family transcriptional regulator n=1 Tax=Neobacillus ginsengisoli TaxID=904295 RepID=A0ABT9XX33_9BACI|nr:DUF4259 domain-containing protein [Neobacillus ginsengisoli]MDQ0200137.1 hypothetical protein [Neobacillus ginsengisoli]